VARNHTADASRLKFQAVQQSEVPRGREGKHKSVIELLLRCVDQLAPGTALKVPLASLPCTKAHIRAALSRATHKRGIALATSSDSSNLYLWKVAASS